MRSESKIIDSDRWLGTEGVTRRILLPDKGREQKAGGRNTVTCKAEDVNGREVYRKTMGGTSVVVQNGLGVEGRRPAQEAMEHACVSVASTSRVNRGPNYVQPRKLCVSSISIF